MSTQECGAAQCGYCEKELLVLKEVEARISEAIMSQDETKQPKNNILHKQHDDMYVSAYGGMYCSRECAVMFTED